MGQKLIFKPTALGRIDVGVCYTRGARSRRWCGLWRRRGRFGGLFPGQCPRRFIDSDREVMADVLFVPL